MDKYLIDSHKLIYHPECVSNWLRYGDVSPIYMEISPTNTCNFKCIYCAFDYSQKKEKVFIDSEAVYKLFKDITRSRYGNGLKSVCFAGEGEPFLHPDIYEMIKQAKINGIDVAVSSNGVLWNKELIEKTAEYLTWIRLSVDAGNEEDYAKIHNTCGKSWYSLWNNIKYALEFKKQNNLKIQIGIQALLMKENYESIFRLIKLSKQVGLDYLIIKPAIKHNYSINQFKNEFTIDEINEFNERLEKYKDGNTEIIFRMNAFHRLEKERKYKKCYGLPFFCEIASDGNIYTCGPFLCQEKFCYGNIYEQSFEEIWSGQKRKDVLEYVSGLDVNKDCMKNCRLDLINQYLWDLKNPMDNVNFI